MNILSISNNSLDESQGAGYIILNTCKALLSLGHKVNVITPSFFSFLPSLNNRARYYRMVLGMAIWFIRNRKLVSSYHLIIIYGTEAWLAVFLLKNIFKSDVPIVLHSNGLEVHVGYRLNFFSKYLHQKKKWFHFNHDFFSKYCYNNVNAILTLSKYDRDFAVDILNINSEKVFFNEPCLPDLFFSYSGNSDVERLKIITFCGSWIARKGVEIIELAIPKILKNNPDYKFRIIGVGFDFDKSKHFPQSVASQIEVFPSVKSKEDILKLYLESSIFLFPSYCESFGLVVAEAMFCGCAVVSGPTGISAELENNVEAIVLDIPSVISVEKAVEQLIGNKYFRETLGENAKKRVKYLHWNNFTAKLKVFIELVLAS